MNPSITFILVETETPDNIGAAARAMKNMGLSDLRLVKPPRMWKKKARKMAMSAKDILEQASVFPDLKKAVKDCHLVIGTTRRKGVRRGAFLLFPKALALARKQKRQGRVGIVFGKESKGLANKHIALCDWVTTIPSAPVYPSLNLAQAVMVVAYSLFTSKKISERGDRRKPGLYVSKHEIDDVLKRFETALIALNYRREGPDILERIQATFRRLFSRSGLTRSEAQMFKGLARRISDNSFSAKGIAQRA